MKTSYSQIQPYATKDGSLIRELMHPKQHGNKNLSFAQAEIEPGRETIEHVHKTSEEIYHVAQGAGVMTLGDEIFSIEPGDTICILPNISHKVKNTGSGQLIIYCCCAPAYSHEDTEMCAKMA